MEGNRPSTRGYENVAGPKGTFLVRIQLPKALFLSIRRRAPRDKDRQVHPMEFAKIVMIRVRLRRAERAPGLHIATEAIQARPRRPVEDHRVGDATGRLASQCRPTLLRVFPSAACAPYPQNESPQPTTRAVRAAMSSCDCPMGLRCRPRMLARVVPEWPCGNGANPECVGIARCGIRMEEIERRVRRLPGQARNRRTMTIRRHRMTTCDQKTWSGRRR
jgi:hypothetical protein